MASFTKAAAAELAGRKLPVSENRLGTLHAIAYRALGCPPLAQEAKMLKMWNEEYPQWSLSGDYDNLDEMTGDLEGGGEGAKLFNEYMRWRALREIYFPARIEALHAAWTKFKLDTDTIDFTDMIEQALDRIPVAPGEPAVGFFDEVQDFSRLELDLVRQWAGKMQQVQLAGDDDQSIYYFKGATPDAFLNPAIPEQYVRVLAQSHRLPRVIKEYADQWIQCVSCRQPKIYDPRDCEGEIIHSQATYREPKELLDELLQAGRKVMVLASCSYMLGPVLTLCRDAGVAFHNPYRRSAYHWNPLQKRKGSVSSLDRLKAFLVPINERRTWRGTELKLWTDCIDAGTTMYRGAKAAIEDFVGDNEALLSIDDIYKFIQKEHLDAIYRGDLDWFEDHLTSAKVAGMKLPLAIARNRGLPALLEEPQVVIGTIHSVKGGEADVVILFPDISRAASESWSRDQEGRDSVRRTFYVGITRAKEKLILCRPAPSGSAVNWRV